MSNAPGILIVGHGTRNPFGCSQFLELAENIKKLFPTVPVEAGFLELAEPSIADALNTLARNGANRFAVLPILLFAAGHAKSDIPNEVQTAASQLQMECLGQSAPLGSGEQALQISTSRFFEAFELDSTPVPDLMRCGLCMIGRGASDPDAIQQMMQLVDRRRATTPMSWISTGFFTAAQPTVDQALDDAAKTDCERIFVQPHLLFEGQLTKELRSKIEERENGSVKRFRMVETLGCSEDVSRAFASEFIKNPDFAEIFPNSLC